MPVVSPIETIVIQLFHLYCWNLKLPSTGLELHFKIAFLFRRTRINAVKLFFIIADTPDKYARVFAS
jgi:hypothetical protein